LYRLQAYVTEKGGMGRAAKAAVLLKAKLFNAVERGLSLR